MKDRYQRQAFWLFVIGASVLAAGLGLREPWPPDEPRFALIAKDMVQSGDWLIPRVGGVLYPDKPPLFFWLVGAFYALTGSVRISILLPTFLSGLGVLWLVHDLARRIWNPGVAVWAGATLLATLQFPLQMKAGQIDGLLCFWTTLGLYGLCRHLLLGPDWRWYAIAGFSCGLGVITKGVGFLPFLILIPYLFARQGHWPLPAIAWSTGKWLVAPAAFVLAISVWLIPMLLVTSGSADPDLLDYRDNILLKQTVTRYADAWGHLKPPWYLFTNAVPLLWLPVSALLPWLVPAWVRDLRSRSTTTLMLGSWILLLLVFFSISDGKRSVYIFPAVPALSLLTAYQLETMLAKQGPRRALFAVALLGATLLSGAGVYFLWEPSALQRWLDMPEAATRLSWVIVGIGVAAIALVAVLRPKHAAAALAAVGVTLWMSASLVVYPLIDATRSGRAIVRAADRETGTGETLAFAGWKEQFLLQWNRPAVHFGYRRHDYDAEARDAANWLSENDSARLVLPSGMIEPCFDRSTLVTLGHAHRQDWFLAAGNSVQAECRAGSTAETTADENIVRYAPSLPRGKAQAGVRIARPRQETEQSAASYPLSRE